MWNSEAFKWWMVVLQHALKVCVCFGSTYQLSFNCRLQMSVIVMKHSEGLESLVSAT